MKVVGHEAVRHYFGVMRRRGTQKVLGHLRADISVSEVFVALERAHCEEDALCAGRNIGRIGEVGGDDSCRLSSKSRTGIARLKPSRYGPTTSLG